MAKVGPGLVTPLFPPSPAETSVPVGAFLLDRRPVTNAQYLAFVEANPKWRRGAVAGLFADEAYLRQWAGPLEPGAGVEPDGPVVQVSWFAARAYCAAQGKRLPSEAEWELAAAASEKEADASGSAAWRERILAWYARPSPAPLPPVGSSAPNFWGVFDLHGLVWEWVSDFNGSFVASDSRRADDEADVRFCGAASQRAEARENYASFMRYAFRSSLEARYTASSLGFRCAASLPGGEAPGGRR